MIPARPPSNPTPRPSDRLLPALLLAAALAAWLALAPILSLAAGMLLFDYVPASFEIIPLVPRPGTLPQPVIGLILLLGSFLLQTAVIAPCWVFSRARGEWKTLHAAAGGLMAAAFYMLVWPLAGLPFAEGSIAPSLLRIGAAAAALGLLFRPLHPRASAGFGKSSSSTWLVAVGTSVLLLLPWMVFGALGTPAQTGSALAEALSYGIGEELLLRGIVAAMVARATGKPRLGFLMGMLFGLAVQPGYILPLGDIFSIFRLFNTIAVGLLATELAARGSLGGAILVHAAFEFGFPAWVDGRMEFGLPHPASLESVGIVFLLAIILAAVRTAVRALAVRQSPGLRASVSAAFAILALAGSGASYVLYGHPGTIKDGFLIIFREHADLSGAEELSDRTERIAGIYQALTETASRSQSSARAELDRLGAPYRPHYLINLIEVYGRRDLMSVFASRPEVREVVDNPNVRLTNYVETMDVLALPMAGNGVEWNISAVGAPSLWAEGVDGSGIVVGGIDTGVDWTHPALQAQYRGGSAGAASHDYNWYDPWDGSAEPWDDIGHGTYTLGTVLGREGTANQIGMAPGASWIGCRSMRYGIGNPASYLACLEFFLAPFPINGDPLLEGRPDLAPHIVNNSWGCPPREGCGAETLAPAFSILRTAGIMMVAAAGNEGPACSTASDPPANSGDVFTVGASEKGGALAFFSSRGPAAGIVKPDLVAPGWLVRSCIPGGKYTISAGTSIAAPHVTGAAALLWSAFPKLIGDIDRTISILQRTADPVAIDSACGVMQDQGMSCLCGTDTATGIPNNSFGYGILNVLAAYEEMHNH
jgi:subtilisin family serine protease